MPQLLMDRYGAVAERVVLYFAGSAWAAGPDSFAKWGQIAQTVRRLSADPISLLAQVVSLLPGLQTAGRPCRQFRPQRLPLTDHSGFSRSLGPGEGNSMHTVAERVDYVELLEDTFVDELHERRSRRVRGPWGPPGALRSRQGSLWTAGRPQPLCADRGRSLPPCRTLTW